MTFILQVPVLTLISVHVNSVRFSLLININTHYLFLGFSGSLLPRPSRDTLREGRMGQEKLTIVFNASAG